MGKIGFRERRQVPDLRNPEEVIYGRVSIDPEKCTGCKLCLRVCVAYALIVENKKCRMRDVRTEGGECLCCGACQAMCPENAISMVSQNRYAGKYKTIDRGDMLRPRIKYPDEHSGY